MKTPLTKKKLKDHFGYNLWKYALLIALAWIGWDLIFTATAYRAPAEKRVDVYLTAATGDQAAFNDYLDAVRLAEMPDMEESSSVLLTMAEDYYGAIQLSTYVMAAEGDIYLLNKENFISYAGQGALMELQPRIDAGELDAGETDLASGIRAGDDGEKRLYGIPAGKTTGLTERFGIPVKDMYWCILVNNGNDDNSVKLLNILLRDLQPAQEAATATDLSNNSNSQ